VAVFLIPVVAREYPFFTYYPAVMLGGFVGGLRPGLVALLASEVALAGFWLPMAAPRDPLALLVFFLTGVALAALMETMHRAHDRLDAALVQERQSNTMKDAFLTSLSHELRTPLNVVMGYSQMLQVIATDERMKQGLDTIRRNADAQFALVEELLDSQRIVQGQFGMKGEMVQLDTLAYEAIKDLGLAAQKGGIHFASRIENVLLWGDAARLRQLFRNLLDNAVKFTKSPGCIGLTIRRVGEAAEIVVEDSGIGIEADFLPYVFERFRQADQSHSREHQMGLGLGLAIAKAIVEAHDGDITVFSAGKDRGTVFTVRLPVRQEPDEEVRLTA
jgi:signal transduction histidine kinase